VNEIGTLCINGPNVFPGYLDPSQNQKIWPKSGWLNTGDLARQDEDGYFWLTGRSKDLIIRGGHNIDPSLIEGPAQAMTEIELASAVGQPDAHAGEVPVVFVQPQKGIQVSAEEILAYLAEHIGERAAIPKEVFILEQMPLTAVGKIFKPKLRWLAIEHVYRKALTDVVKLADSLKVSVGESTVHGTLATITVKLPTGVDEAVIRRQIADKLGPFMTKYNLVFT
ncbi:AMP-binding protein, partial [bacterium]|nr:AMP-binding protein [bacterium]